MTREIKFRAWDAERKQHFYSDAYGLEGFFARHADDPLEQFTGLKDRKGNALYEGDIVRGKLITDEGKGWKKSRKFLGVMEFDTSWGWRLKVAGKYMADHGLQRTGDHLMRDFNEYTYELVGNVHANPELLEQKP